MAITLDGTNGIVAPSVENADGAFRPLISGTAVATTSGTAFDFTGIPSWAKRITVLFTAVSTNSNSPILIQVGSGSLTTTGYVSSSGYATTSGAARTTATTGFVQATMSAVSTISGASVIYLHSGNIYVNSGVLDNTGGVTVNMCSGTVTLGNVLDRIRVTTVNGTDTFDAGSINIMYE